MSILQETIKLKLDIDDVQRKYSFVPMSKEYQNYTRQRDEGREVLTGTANRGNQALLGKALDALAKKTADSALKEYARSNPHIEVEI